MSRRVVAFLDVLGFSQLVERVSQDQLVALYQELMAAANKHTALAVYPDDQRKWEEEPVFREDEVSHVAYVHMVIASDSIVVFSYSDQPFEAGRVVTAVNELLIAGFGLGLPLRGAITVGELDIVHADDVVAPGTRLVPSVGLVGAALVTAVRMEGLFEWSGAVIDQTLVDWLQGDVQMQFEDGDWTAWDMLTQVDVTSARVPRKDLGQGAPARRRRRFLRRRARPSYEERWVVSWPTRAFLTGKLTENDIREAFESYGRDASANSVQAKRRNTLEFWSSAAAGSA
jgi:hypothetical protein